MDPFFEVLEDAQHQTNSLNEFLSKLNLSDISEDSKADFSNNTQELHETIEDLKESIESSKSDPDFFKVTKSEIAKREDIVNKLESGYQKILNQWNSKLGNAQDGSNPFQRYTDDHDSNQPTNAEVNAYNEYQQQQLINEQDQHLDGVYQSMQTINQQARAMGNELEEQAYIIDEIDGDLDRIGNKVSRGMRRVEHVIRANQERFSDCCIGLLIVALVVLLVLVIIV